MVDYEFIDEQINKAREKHPEFQGIMCVMREVADLIKADEKGDEEEIKRQALHVAITAIRMYNGE